MKPDSIVICGLQGLLRLQDKHYLTPDIVVYGNRKLKVSQIFPAKKKGAFVARKSSGAVHFLRDREHVSWSENG